MKVTIFTGAWCAPCKMLKRYLDTKGISYTEKPVEDELNAQEAFSISGQFTVPITRIGNEIVIGYNLSNLSDILERARI